VGWRGGREWEVEEVGKGEGFVEEKRKGRRERDEEVEKGRSRGWGALST